MIDSRRPAAARLPSLGPDTRRALGALGCFFCVAAILATIAMLLPQSTALTSTPPPIVPVAAPHASDSPAPPAFSATTVPAPSAPPIGSASRAPASSAPNLVAAAAPTIVATAAPTAPPTVPPTVRPAIRPSAVPRAGGAALPPIAPSPAPSENIADRAYRELAAGAKAAAAADFRTYLAANPNDAQVWLDLAYLDADLVQLANAIADIERYIALKPADDRAKLQRAYYLDSAKHTSEANAAFGALQTSPDVEVAKAARAEVVARAGGTERPSHGEVYGYIQNESRFGDNFYGFDAKRLLGRGATSPYVILHYTADTRSGAGQGAQIFNDNAAVVDLGVRARIGSAGPYVFVEGGEGFGLLNQGNQTDLRYGAAYSGEFGNVLRAHTTVDASVATYSRYTNTILYAGLSHDFPFKGRLRWVVGANLALDAHRVYSNNYGELFGGAEYNARNVKIRLIGAGGTYFSRGIGVPAAKSYTTVRPQVIFGFGL